jgi:hypothetical protein
MMWVMRPTPKEPPLGMIMSIYNGARFLEQAILSIYPYE